MAGTEKIERLFRVLDYDPQHLEDLAATQYARALRLLPSTLAVLEAGIAIAKAAGQDWSLRCTPQGSRGRRPSDALCRHARDHQPRPRREPRHRAREDLGRGAAL